MLFVLASPRLPRALRGALLGLTALALCAAPLFAGELLEGTIQQAIDDADPGAVILLPAGEWNEDIDFGGKALTLRGTGEHSVIRGTGAGPVVTFDDGEGPDSILDSVTITGGVASAGGGVLIDGASPTLVRCVITGNRASSAGSGVQIRNGSSARLFNNLVSYNTRNGGGDPHGIQISGSSPAVVNNTIVRVDSNGIHLSGGAAAVILNNVIARNGSKVGGQVRGRGICDFSGGASVIRHNVFSKNRVSALLRGGKDWKRMKSFQKKNPDDTAVSDNVDGRPGFLRRPPKSPEKVRCLGFHICDEGKGRAIDAGIDLPGAEDLDGSRNTAGHTGGPFAAGSHAIPDADSVGVAPLD